MRKPTFPGKTLRAASLLALVGSASLSLEHAARAQAAGPVTPAAAAEARTHSAAGLKYQKLGVCEAAIPELEQAFKLGGKPADLLAALECRKTIADYTGAYDDLAQLATVTTLSARDKTSVEATRAQLDAATGSLDVTAPTGAAIEVDGKQVGSAPLGHALHLAVGPHVVRALAGGFEPWRSVAQIAAGQKVAVSAQLQPALTQGHLFVREASGADVHVWLDGQDMGPAPWDGDVPPGSHTITAKGTGLAAPDQTVQLGARQQQGITLVAAATTGHIQVIVTPPAAAIQLDGQAVGAGKSDTDVLPGDHVLHIELDGYKTVEKHIKVALQGTQVESVQLEPFVSQDELAKRKAEEDAAALHGGYGQVTLFGAYPAVGTHLDCTEPTAPAAGVNESCSPGFVYGGGVTARGGYSFGAVGLELVGLFMYNRWEDDVSYSGSSGASSSTTNSTGAVAHSEAYTFQTMGGMAALGPRLTTSGRHFRVTLGAAGGVVFRNFQLDRSTSGGLSESPSYSANALVISPGATADLGLIIGSTPGANFVIGAMTWLEFPSTTQVDAKSAQFITGGGAGFSAQSGPFTVEKGPQVYVGPYLGIRFGH